MPEAIEVENLTKRYGDLTAVDDISFSIHEGEVFGILGPNGAGKTTTLEVIEGLLSPTSGRTLVMGMDTHRQSEEGKRHIGVQLQASAYFEYLTLREILDLFGRFYPRRLSPAELLDKVDLTEKADTTVGKLSGGQKQRIALARAVIRDPLLLILDEATASLDARSEGVVLDALRNACFDRTTLLIAHNPAAVAIADRILVMRGGRVVEAGTFQELSERDGYFSERSHHPQAALTL